MSIQNTTPKEPKEKKALSNNAFLILFWVILFSFIGVNKYLEYLNEKDKREMELTKKSQEECNKALNDLIQELKELKKADKN